MRDPSSHSWFRRHWVLSGLGAVLLIAGLLAHFYLHSYLVRYVNQKLNESPDYKARVEDIGVHLWRGAYSIDGLKVEKREGESVIPFFKATTIDISLQWKELFHRHIVAKVILTDPEINIVSSKNKAIEQKKVNARWQDQVQALIPFRLNYVKIVEGKIHWRDPASDPPMDIYLHGMNVSAYNLTNSERLSKTLASTVVGDAIAMKDGRLHFEATADPYAERPTFKAKLTLKDLGLPQLNTFFKKYAALEVRDGTFSLYLEMAGRHGELSGYVKPIIDHLNKVELKHEKKSAGEVIKGTVIEILIGLLTNTPKDRLGTRLEIEGRYDQPDVNVWIAVSSALRNAFIKAIPAKLDQALNLHDRDKTEIKNLKK